MDNLLPNSFGCDGIACPAQTYLRPSGKQTRPHFPCLPCGPMNSLQLGMTKCSHTIIHSTKSPLFSKSISSAPTTSYVSSDDSSNNPSFQSNSFPIIDSKQSKKFPSGLETSFPFSAEPYIIPTTKYSSLSPILPPQSYSNLIQTNAPSIINDLPISLQLLLFLPIFNIIVETEIEEFESQVKRFIEANDIKGEIVKILEVKVTNQTLVNHSNEMTKTVNMQDKKVLNISHHSKVLKLNMIVHGVIKQDFASNSKLLVSTTTKFKLKYPSSYLFTLNIFLFLL